MAFLLGGASTLRQPYKPSLGIFCSRQDRESLTTDSVGSYEQLFAPRSGGYETASWAYLGYSLPSGDSSPKTILQNLRSPVLLVDFRPSKPLSRLMPTVFTRVVFTLHAGLGPRGDPGSHSKGNAESPLECSSEFSQYRNGGGVAGALSEERSKCWNITGKVMQIARLLFPHWWETDFDFFLNLRLSLSARRF